MVSTVTPDLLAANAAAGDNVPRLLAISVTNEIAAFLPEALLRPSLRSLEENSEEVGILLLSGASAELKASNSDDSEDLMLSVLSDDTGTGADSVIEAEPRYDTVTTCLYPDL